MTRYTITAEHCSGKSVSHPCTTGIYSDPTDQFQIEIEAENQEEAERLGFLELEKLAREYEPCKCRRRLQPASNSWFESVAIHAEPVPPLDKTAWNTYRTVGYTYNATGDQPSSGGVHQVRHTASGWQKRILQSNGRASSTGPIESISDADGEACFATAQQSS